MGWTLQLWPTVGLLTFVDAANSKLFYKLEDVALTNIIRYRCILLPVISLQDRCYSLIKRKFEKNIL